MGCSLDIFSFQTLYVLYCMSLGNKIIYKNGQIVRVINILSFLEKDRKDFVIAGQEVLSGDG